MRNTFICNSLLGSLLLLGAAAHAQPPAAAPAPAKPAAAEPAKPETPRPSPAAKVSQRVGLTDISVDYSSPAVKKRKIWGDLVPYDKLWRTGANSSTKVTFSKDVVVGDKPVPAGTYSLLSIPGKASWTLILNKDTTIGGSMDKHVADQDVARVTVKPKTSPFRERLTFIFSNVTDDAVDLDLEWDKQRITLPLKAPSK